MSFSSKRTVSVNESIISLLLQLHSKLSEKPDSYHPKPKIDKSAQESRIGDGVLFIERVLDIIAGSDEEKLRCFQAIRQRLWPKKDEAGGSPSMENIDKEERLVVDILFSKIVLLFILYPEFSFTKINEHHMGSVIEMLILYIIF